MSFVELKVVTSHPERKDLDALIRVDDIVLAVADNEDENITNIYLRGDEESISIRHKLKDFIKLMMEKKNV